MPYDSRRHHRRSIRLPDYDYNRPGGYFVTICTQDHDCLFGEVQNGAMYENEYGRIVRDIWTALPDRYAPIETDAFVVMPNHAHGIVVIAADDATHDDDAAVGAIHESPPQRESPRHEPPSPIVKRRRMLLSRVMGFWKMNAAKRINRWRDTPGTSVWQRNYYEHIIRSRRDLERIRAYIQQNPQRWTYDKLYQYPKNT